MAGTQFNTGWKFTVRIRQKFVFVSDCFASNPCVDDDYVILQQLVLECHYTCGIFRCIPPGTSLGNPERHYSRQAYLVVAWRIILFESLHFFCFFRSAPICRFPYHSVHLKGKIKSLLLSMVNEHKCDDMVMSMHFHILHASRSTSDGRMQYLKIHLHLKG